MSVPALVRNLLRGVLFAAGVFVAVGCAPLHPEQGPVRLDAGRAYYRVGPHMSYLLDPGRQFSFEDALARRDSFQPVRGYYPTFGITTDAVWLRFEVEPGEFKQSSWLLELATPLLEEMRLYRRSPDGAYAVQTLAARTPIPERFYPHHYFIFPLGEIERSEVMYLRVVSHSTLHVPTFFWNSRAFPMLDMLRTFGYGVFYGLMLVMALYNFFLYISIRDRAYLYYVFYILTVSEFFALISGHAAYLVPGAYLGKLAMFGPPLSLVAASFALLFSRSFLLIRTQQAPASRLIDGILVINSIAIVAMFWLDSRLVVALGNLLPLLSIAVLLGCAIRLAQRGYRPAYYFLLAWSTLILGVVLFVLQNLAVIASGFITQYGLFIGAGLEAVLLSFALGYRINLLQKTEAESRRLLLAEQATALARERGMTDSFARFVPGEFLHFLGKDSVLEISHGDVVRKDMAVLFTDIRGFTGLSERLGPEATFSFLNEFHGLLEPVIKQHGGFIDKFIGDAIMALFPDADRSVRAAIQMQYALRDESSLRTRYDLRIGVGVHFGAVMLGTVGSPGRLETTVIGDTVNVASRIEGVNKSYGTEIVISDAAYKSVQGDASIICRELDAIRVRGKTRPIVLFELLNTLANDTRELRLRYLDEYMRGMLAYRAGEFGVARQAFESYLRGVGTDEAAAVYLRRLERLLAAPPTNWDGIWGGE